MIGPVFFDRNEKCRPSERTTILLTVKLKKYVDLPEKNNLSPLHNLQI